MKLPTSLTSTVLRLSLLLPAAGALGCAGPEERAEPGLVGVWEAPTAEQPGLLSIESERVVWRRGEDTRYSVARIDEGGLNLFFYGSVERVPVEWTGEGLLVGDDPPVLYRRSSEDAAALEPVALEVAEMATLDGARRDALVAELLERGERDQEVRAAAQESSSPSALGDMLRVDRDNTARMIELLADVGWIDAERFGTDAARAAFLIVQHSGNLALMSACLPHIHADWEAGRIAGSSYALMHDRLELDLGRPQVYGSQILGLPTNNSFVVGPLVDPAAVDERRATVGLEPLGDYLARFADDLGAIGHFDWDAASPLELPPPLEIE